MTDRRVGSVGLTVDFVPGLDRRIASVGLMVDLVPTLEVGLSTTQATAVSVALVVTPAGPVELTGSTSQAQSLSLELLFISGAAEITVATTQTQALALRQAVSLHVGLMQATQASLFQQLVRTVVVAATQAQAVVVTLSRGYQRVVAAVQATSITRQRLIFLVRKLAGQGVRTRVDRRPGTAIQPTVATTARTQVRLIRQVRLARALSQPQATSTTLVRVAVMQTVATTQAQSLALQRDVTLGRSAPQSQAVLLPRGLELIQPLVQPTALVLGRAINLVRALVVGSSATVEIEDVTVRYEVLVTASVSQQVALTSAGAGTTAREFVAVTRSADFTADSRSHAFAVSRRGARFTVEVR